MRSFACFLAILLVSGLSIDRSHGQVRTTEPKVAPKTYLVEMRAKPWTTIFEWLTDQTGTPFVSKHKPPPGTCNLITKAGQRYSQGELIDLINDALAAHQYVLLRSPTCFRLVPADERIDKSLLPHVRLEDLPERGHSEFVETVLPLRFMSAEDYAQEVRQMMGVFGEVVVLRQGNRLLLHDRAGKLRQIVALTKELEEAQTRVYTLDRVSATRVAELLRQLMPEVGNHPVIVHPPGK